MTKISFMLAGLMISTLISTQALAFPMPDARFRPEDNAPSLELDFNFEGIVSLSNCSGSLIRYETSQATDHAMILTNGHCIETGFTEPHEIVSHLPSDRKFNILNPSGQSVGRVTATFIIYSTMTKTDITLYELQETFADIQNNFNVSPLTLASSHPQKQQNIEIISGFWKRGYQCQITDFIYQLNESKWSFNDSIRFSQPGCETIGGTSGSPIVLKGTRTVIGINNTGNESGESCTMNNPCEVDANGKVTAQKGLSYGQQTFWIYSCLNSRNEMDLNQAGCQLPH